MSEEIPGSIDGTALARWYSSAHELLRALDACRQVVDSMMVGTAATNLLLADELAELTRNAEFWLAAHPCPDPRTGEHMGAIAHAYAMAGDMVVDAGGDSTNADQAELKDIVTEAGVMLDEVTDLVDRLAMATEI